MPLCTICGTVLHEEDVATHTCKAENTPAKGSPNNLIEEIKNIKARLNTLEGG